MWNCCVIFKLHLKRSRDNKSTHTILPSPAPLRRSNRQHPPPHTGSSCLAPDPTEGKSGNLALGNSWFHVWVALGPGWAPGACTCLTLAYLIGLHPKFLLLGRRARPWWRTTVRRKKGSCHIEVLLLFGASILSKTAGKQNPTVLHKQANRHIMV